ncbi:MAG: hypothetical protein ACREBC_01410 [Pyrinomonadaceae bacterium]
MNIKAYELTDDFRRDIETGGGLLMTTIGPSPVTWEKGHALAARVMAEHLAPPLYAVLTRWTVTKYF